ncbi:GH92 family glycosyl hydrolase [Psychromicrobium xiongbiense]|uniref:GH92 family glycosyl hydrolase n=1 Tax=Psychromicrobium xiongbiense TaxID=3051184 RepID=UPI002552AF98|nr:GH92 family glycosyl hydrolase [Psychromicrobium sp. YIM S02556]
MSVMRAHDEPPVPGSFSTSFEDSQTPAALISVVETGTDGTSMASGINGARSASTMNTTVGNGPDSGYNIKAHAGFTGLRSLRYSGTKTVAGRAYATNKLFEVHLPVGPDSRLSYTVIPDADYTSYLPTYVAIDLHFTDGSYLSTLGATDQNGVPLTAQGQGDGKILYPAQWNYVSSALGEVAKGKTIDRILLSVDNSAAPAGTAFGGWLDDVSIEGNPIPIDGSSRTHYVDTRRGTNASGQYSRGNNLPLTAVPNGFNFLTPVTDASSSNWEYSYQSANNAENLPTLQGLAVSHIPSPWMGDRQQFSVMPQLGAGTPSSSKSARQLAFSHRDEIAQPDYYSVKLAGNLRAEMTPSDHGGILRFTFPDTAGTLVFDSPKSGAVFSFSGSTVTGTVPAQGGSGQGDMYVYGSFDQAPSSTQNSGPSFAGFTTAVNPMVNLSFATSFLSADQARHNFDLEIAGQSFEQVRAAARAQWNDRLAVIDVQGANDSQLTTLYSNLYRLNLYPNSGFENTGSTQAPVHQYRSPVSQNASGVGRVVNGRIYVNNGFWDTYRTAWPAYSLLYPQKAAELIDGFVQQYRDGGWIARWSSPGYADLMTGTSSDVAFADAYLKGVPLPDPLGAYDAAVRNATVPSTGNAAVGRKGLDTSIFTGYTDTTTEESVSWGLEGYINDFGLGNMAAKLAADPMTPQARRAQLTEDSAYYLNRAWHYVNMFDSQRGFFNGRSRSGEFQGGLDPLVWGGLFTETDGWNFAFHAPHDGAGLAALHGGPKGLETTLDDFFATPETANHPGGYGSVIHEMLEARDVRMGQLGISNQPSHHIPYIYNYAGAPAKTQAVVREIQQRLFVGSEIGQGYPGDEDNGEMSAWNIFSSLGFYPLQVGSPYFSIGSPQFTRATIHWGNGKTLTINAANNSQQNVYVQSLMVNGKDHPSTVLSQSEIADGGTLDFVMGPAPSSWGTSDAVTVPVREPLMDTTGDAQLSSDGGEDLRHLSDNSSASQVSFSTATPVITVGYRASRQKVGFYTLTSGSTSPGSDPSAWTLEGSDDGKVWTVLDRRTGVTFNWRLQTRPFQIATPTAFSRYRLTVTATRDGSPATVTEFELLAKASDAVSVSAES